VKVSKDWIEIELGASRFWRDLRRDLPELRHRSGVTQRELARAIGTSQGNVSTAEAGGSGDVWGIDRTVAWLAAIGHQITSTGPEGEVEMISSWGPAAGRWLASIRRKAGLSQPYLAELLGVSPSTIQTIEIRGAASMTTTIVGFLAALGWSVSVVPIPGFVPGPAPVRPEEQRKLWRDRARRRALTRLAALYQGEYALMRLAVLHDGGSVRKARGVLLAGLQKAHPDSYWELYRDELKKEPPPTMGSEAARDGGGDQAAGRNRSR
jgi:transcriptional regulator with XRE-family HTH domain